MSLTSRPSRDFLNLQIAELISQRATCLRAKVGCVITIEGRIISTGYNGTLVGVCNEAVCDIKSKCRHAVHAEANAISFAASMGIKLNGATLYCTYCPCYECAKLIAQSGITRVVYMNEYHSMKDTVDLLFDLNIELVTIKQNK